MTEVPKSYLWPHETIPTLDLAHHLQDLVEFREFLLNRGIQIAGTRLERYIQYFEHSLSGSKLDETKIFKSVREGPLQNPTDWLLYLLREAHELMWILKGFKRNPPTGIDDRLRTLIGGSDFAALDTDSLSRNTQFELRIASYFSQAGCEVDLGGTDIVALTQSEAFYVECKRVASKKQITKRLSEAKKQLQKRMSVRRDRTVVGVIAMDLTKAAFSHNGLTIGWTSEHSRDVIQAGLLDLTSHLDTSSLFTGCSGLIDLWFQIHISSAIFCPATPTTRFSSYHIFRENLNKKQARAAKALQAIFEAASKADERSQPSRPLTRKTKFELPAGAVFSFDETLLRQLFDEGCAKECDESKVIGTITMNGRTHEFSFFDLVLIGGTEVRDWQKDLGEDPAQARLELLMRMYSKRFPFEDDD